MLAPRCVNEPASMPSTIMKPHIIVRLALSSTLAIAGLVTFGCDDDGGGSKSVCEQAGDVLINDYGFEADDGGGESAACEGDAAATAQCIVDFPSETCDAFDPANLTDPMFSNGYTECVAAIAGG